MATDDSLWAIVVGFDCAATRSAVVLALAQATKNEDGELVLKRFSEMIPVEFENSDYYYDMVCCGARAGTPKATEWDLQFGKFAREISSTSGKTSLLNYAKLVFNHDDLKLSLRDLMASVSFEEAPNGRKVIQKYVDQMEAFARPRGGNAKDILSHLVGDIWCYVDKSIRDDLPPQYPDIKISDLPFHLVPTQPALLSDQPGYIEAVTKGLPNEFWPGAHIHLLNEAHAVLLRLLDGNTGRLPVEKVLVIYDNGGGTNDFAAVKVREQRPLHLTAFRRPSSISQGAGSIFLLFQEKFCQGYFVDFTSETDTTTRNLLFKDITEKFREEFVRRCEAPGMSPDIPEFKLQCDTLKRIVPTEAQHDKLKSGHMELKKNCLILKTRLMKELFDSRVDSICKHAHESLKDLMLKYSITKDGIYQMVITGGYTEP